MKSNLMSIVIGLVLPTMAFTQQADKDSTNRDYNPNILIFTSEVRNFIDQAAELFSLQTQMKEATDETQTQNLKKSIENKTALLQLTGHRVAESYFAEVAPETKNDFNNFLTETLSARTDLNNYYVFLGNAFAERATKMVGAHKAKLKKIYVWSTIGGVVLGFAGGYYFMKWRGAQATSGELLKAGLIGFGIASVVSTGGFVIRYVLPVDQSIGNALDFNARYPHGEDFIEDLQGDSLDLAFQLEGLDSAGEKE